jgi:hypothetical protein
MQLLLRADHQAGPGRRNDRARPNHPLKSDREITCNITDGTWRCGGGFPGGKGTQTQDEKKQGDTKRKQGALEDQCRQDKAEQGDCQRRQGQVKTGPVCYSQANGQRQKRKQ